MSHHDHTQHDGDVHEQGRAHHHDVSEVSDARLVGAVALNIVLTLVEVAVGVLSGSLSLLADAAHNFNDAVALLIAYIARRIARRAPDEIYTFGYRRAELIGALINLTSLVFVALFLVAESVERFMAPTEVQGAWVMAASGVALVVDVFTAALLWAMASGSMNVRAAFVHNLTDAAASLFVLVGGAIIWTTGATWVDPLLGLVLGAWILAASLKMLRRTASILMDHAPESANVHVVSAAMREVDGVRGVHHVHVRELDERHVAMEAHVVLSLEHTLGEAADIKIELKRMLLESFGITHATLELEGPDEECVSVGGIPSHEHSVT